MKYLAVKGKPKSKSCAGILAATLLLYAAPSQAGEWEILYMADTGGGRLWVTDDPAEATEVVARVISPDFAVLLTSCRAAPSGMSYLSIGESGAVDGPPFINENSSVSFRVDDNNSYDASAPEYLQSAYYVIVSNSLIREMAAGSRLIMTFGTEPHQRKIFTLRGSQRALNTVDCNALEK